MENITSEWLHESVKVSLPAKRNHDWEQWVLLWSDRHWDNPGSDQDMMLEQLEKAKELGAVIVDIGDFFCAMQGKYDKRSNKSSLRPEHQVSNYLDELVYTAEDFLAPYAEHFAFMGPGNHETSILDRHEVNLTERLVHALRSKGSQCVRHKYNGFTRFELSTENSQHSQTFVMWHTHGYGGGGPVTKDTIQANRQGVFLDGVDIVISGHTHDAWIWPQPTVKLSHQGKVVHGERLHIKIPSAKNKFGKDSWEDLRGMPPKPMGCVWLNFYWERKYERYNFDATLRTPR